MNNTYETIYDVAIIGGGIGGLMTAYHLKKSNSDLKICILEKGCPITKRKCPAAEGKPCAHCKICAITSGMAGSGAYSDGKFNLGTAYGGTLGEAIGEKQALKYIYKVDDILREHCNATYPRFYPSNTDLRLLCLQNNLQLLDMEVRHLGSDRNFEIMQALIEHIERLGVIILHNRDVVDLFKTSTIEIDSNMSSMEQQLLNNSNFCISSFDSRKKRKSGYEPLTDDLQDLYANKVVLALGRSGANFLKSVCEDFQIPTHCNTVDLGVRVEMKDDVWKHFSNKIYEPKILCKTKTFEDKTRSFCFNQGGIVSTESNNGIITANGHSFASPDKKTDNCNFAILSSINFTEPFNEPTEYCENIASLSNKIGKGNVIVQRFGDLIRGRRTTEHRLNQNSVKPTLNATAGDLSLVLPHRIMTNIIETLYALDKVAKGTANDDTLLYGVEAKYYSIKPHTNENFEMIEGIYVCGDCSGICRGLSQSGAMGLYIADRILTE